MSHDDYSGLNEMAKIARHRRTDKGRKRVEQLKEFLDKYNIPYSDVLENVMLVGNLYVYTTKMQIRVKGTKTMRPIYGGFLEFKNYIRLHYNK